LIVITFLDSLYINQACQGDKVEQEKQTKDLFLQVRMDAEHKQKMQEIADRNGVTLSGLLRIWINRSYQKLNRGIK